MQSTIAAVRGIQLAAATPDQAILQNEFYQTLADRANAAAGSLAGATIVPLSAASVGGFNYIWQNSNLEFNAATFNLVNGRIAAPIGSVASQVAGPFASDYAALVQTIGFQYSAADQQRLNKAQTAAGQQATAVVSQYTSTFGPISPEMRAAAKVQTNIDYVIMYVVAQLWSGTADAGEPPVALLELERARDLAELLPNLPASGQSMLGGISSYLGMMASVLPLQQLSSNGNWVLRRLLENSRTPTAANGGMTTVDPNDGTRSTRVRYTIPKAVTDIQNDLSNSSRVIALDFATSEVDSSTVSVSVNGAASVRVPLTWFLGLDASASASYNMFSFQGSGESARISVRYEGFSWVPVGPAQFEQDTVKGWMSTMVLSQAVNNTGGDTGFYFVTPPPFDLQAGGDFGLMKGVLVSNFPTISITYERGDYSVFRESFKEESSWDVRVFGIKIGSFSQSLYRATSHESSTSGGFTVTFTPSAETLTVPDLQKQAFVIGAAIGYPGTGNL